MGVTDSFLLPYPELDDAPNGPLNVQALAEAVDDVLLAAVARKGTYAARPAANAVPSGTMYAATDTLGVWISDGAAWTLIAQGRPSITVAAFATHPGPYDGQEVALQFDAANGIEWALRYRAAGGTYKWECIGGSEAWSVVTTFESTASGTPVNLATVGPSIVIPRSGDYLVRWGVTANVTVSTQQALSALFTAAGVRVTGGEADSGTTSFSSPSSMERVGALVAGTTYQLKYWASGGATGTFANRWLAVKPARIS